VCVFGLGLRKSCKEDADTAVLCSIKNTSSQVLQLLTSTAAALTASEYSNNQPAATIPN
jgi:hypothetical protein